MGSLEQAHAHGDYVVCGPCKTRLSHTPVSQSPAAYAAPAGMTQPNLRTVQTVEATAKKWKLIILIGVLFLLAGFGGCAVSCSEAVNKQPVDPVSAALMAVVLPIGVVIYLIGRIGKWWNHG